MPQVQTPCEQQCSETLTKPEKESIRLTDLDTLVNALRVLLHHVAIVNCCLPAPHSFHYSPSFQSHDLQEIIHNIINFFLPITSGPSKIIAHNHQYVFKVLQLI